MNSDFFVTYYHFAWLYSEMGQYQNAISAFTKGRLLCEDDRVVKIATLQDVALRKAFATEGSAGFWRQLLKSSEIGEFDAPQVYARLGANERR